jgi:hypothetical protein
MDLTLKILKPRSSTHKDLGKIDQHYTITKPSLFNFRPKALHYSLLSRSRSVRQATLRADVVTKTRSFVRNCSENSLRSPWGSYIEIYVRVNFNNPKHVCSPESEMSTINSIRSSKQAASPTKQGPTLYRQLPGLNRKSINPT